LARDARIEGVSGVYGVPVIGLRWRLAIGDCLCLKEPSKPPEKKDVKSINANPCSLLKQDHNLEISAFPY